MRAKPTKSSTVLFVVLTISVPERTFAVGEINCESLYESLSIYSVKFDLIEGKNVGKEKPDSNSTEFRLINLFGGAACSYSFISGPSEEDSFSQLICYFDSVESNEKVTPTKLRSKFDKYIEKISACQPNWVPVLGDNYATFESSGRSYLAMLSVQSDIGLWSTPPYKYSLIYKVKYPVKSEINRKEENCN